MVTVTQLTAQVCWLGLRVGGLLMLSLYFLYEPIDDSAVTLFAPL